jgi:hypothetical protein
MYQCVSIASRSANIIEVRYGRSTSQYPNSELCADKEFERSRWITLGRQQSIQATACPISGDYTGVVPEEKLFCAKISSDCNNPDIMFYTVSLCQNRSHIFEQREYKCFGKWEEDGILYTYTQRRDMPGYQCFTGKLMADGNEVYITEAGQNCVRGNDPLVIGMKITKQGEDSSSFSNSLQNETLTFCLKSFCLASCPRSTINSAQIPMLKWTSRSDRPPALANRKSILSPSSTGAAMSASNPSSALNTNRVSIASIESYASNTQSGPNNLFSSQSNGMPSIVSAPSFAGPSNGGSLSPSIVNGRDQSKDFYQAESTQALHPRIPARGSFLLHSNQTNLTLYFTNQFH